MQRAYSPETLVWLDRLGLTDIFHAWWFLLLLCLFCVCLIFVSAGSLAERLEGLYQAGPLRDPAFRAQPAADGEDLP